ncbi:hypothetical protein [Micromonospora sp. L32]|uniref:hypothetical protein n=1 Tax=Micromonospora sp. L32 TaxID=3452214 RepID=UPI003F8BF52F
MSDLRPSVRATYDSEQTGPRYWVTSTIDGQAVAFRVRIADPFVRHTVRVGLRDLLRGLLRGRLTVEVTVGGDTEVMRDVLELDEQALIHGRTRRAAFQQSIHQKLRNMA